MENYIKEVWVIPLGFATWIGQGGKRRRRRGEIKHHSSVLRLGETCGATSEEESWVNQLCSGEENRFSLSRGYKHQAQKHQGEG